MSGWRQDLAFKWLGRPATVPIAACVHFAGYRFGPGQFNPYADYARKLAAGPRHVAAARAEFTAFLQHYRPRHLGEALGLTLAQPPGLWEFPWSRRGPRAGRDGRRAWLDHPEDCPDLLTHFSAAGIARWRVEQEFEWLEGSFGSIQRHGFQPERYYHSVRAKRLERADGAVAWLLLDGNHRTAALSALGHREVPLRYLPLATVREAEVARWPRVRRGEISAEDARRVLAVYFDGHDTRRTTDAAAPLLEGAAEA